MSTGIQVTIEHTLDSRSVFALWADEPEKLFIALGRTGGLTRKQAKRRTRKGFGLKIHPRRSVKIAKAVDRKVGLDIEQWFIEHGLLTSEGLGRHTQKKVYIELL